MDGFFPTAIMCTNPGCDSLATGIYHTHDGRNLRTCTLHIPQAPATESDSDPDSCPA